jgi:hypothetical protein
MKIGVAFLKRKKETYKLKGAISFGKTERRKICEVIFLCKAGAFGGVDTCRTRNYGIRRM